jgi:PLD-like domain
MNTSPECSARDKRPDFPQISISHCSEQDFLEAFRADLAGSVDWVVILSPFLSQSRAVHYYPVLQVLNARGVTVDVYARPWNEQPESLREHYGIVEQGLRRAGVKFHVRSGMHEKVGVIDGRVLWHGSLNIFSHNNTRESMLRIESSALVYDVLADLGISLPTSAPDRGQEDFSPRAKEDDAADIAPADEAPGCPQCGQQMLFFANAGMWICRESPRCSGTLARGDAEVLSHPSEDDRAGQQLGLACPLCGAPMVVNQGAFLRIVCSSSECQFSLDPRLSAGLVRILGRRRMA